MKDTTQDFTLGYTLAQCTLEKMSDCIRKPGIRKRSAWIPDKFAVIGKYVRIHQHGEWDDGWKVIDVGTKRCYEECMERRDDYRVQRKASDV